MSDDSIFRLNDALEGRYRIERELGEGGMATVYLAEDLRHDRKVAVKVLRPELAAVLGAERFVQEIKTTAGLQHPHILPLFDSGEADSFLYYVMPYVEGETLRDRLNRETQLPVEDAVDIAQAVASALDYAHRHEVIHRDIKPENVLLHDGHALVADFGIALAVSNAGGSRLTETGLSLGTPHYMSPEQATADHVLDGRSDVYALGCMTYEMLVGEPPHTGPTTQAIIAKILTHEIDPPAVRRPTVPSNVDAAIRKSLARLPADRFTTAADFSRAFDDGSFRTEDSVAASTATGRTAWRAAAAGASSIALIAVIALITRTTPELPTHRVSVALPQGQEWRDPWVGSSVTISADGETFAYVGGSGQTWQIWVRHRNRLDATPVPGTTSATDPTLSPDGSEVAFTVGSPGPLKVVTLATGGIRTVADSARWRGLSWGDDGLLYFVTAEGGLARVPRDGGAVEALTTPVDGTGHWDPSVLPGAKGAVFKIVATIGSADPKLAAVDFGSGEVKELGPSGSDPFYLSTGDLAWMTSSGDVMAAPFDVHRLELTGAAVRIVEDVWGGSWAHQAVRGHLAVSASGTLLYRRGDDRTLVTPVWVARDGTSEAVVSGWDVPIRTGSMGIAMSPDGSRFVMPLLGQANVDLWVRDLAGTPSRLTFGGNSARPQWSPGGEDVAFVSDKVKTLREAFVKRADGSGPSRRVLTSDRQIDEVTYSHDGKWFVYRLGTGADRDIYAARTEGDSVGAPLVATEYEERSPMLSPDDRWMAYVSNESGPDEVFVVKFPDAGASKWQVSADGGTEPVWSRDGRELFYRDANDNLVAVEVGGASSFVVGPKRVLFSARPYAPDLHHSNYDVGPDGRFLMLRTVSTGGGELILVDNWLTELSAMLKKQ